MSKLFKRLKGMRQSNRSISVILTGYVKDKLQQFAKYLAKKTNHLQPGRLALSILAFCVAFSLVLTARLFFSFKHKTEIHFQSISTPVSKPPTSFSGDAITLQGIKHFHHQLDSLKKNNFLRYDSIMKCRPHLLDSIVMVERLEKF